VHAIKLIVATTSHRAFAMVGSHGGVGGWFTFNLAVKLAVSRDTEGRFTNCAMVRALV
jgi:hypothetical protein